MASKTGNVVTAGDHRIWVQEDGPGPGNAPEYMGCWVPGDSEWSFGDTERIECPDPENYRQFVDVDSIQGAIERPTVSYQARYTRDLSDMLKYGRKRCPISVYVFVGRCRNPQDWDSGWEKIKIYPDFNISSWSDENAGALASGDQSPTNETLEGSAREILELKSLIYGTTAESEATNTIRAVVICDSIECGDCGVPSDGCSVIFMAMDGLPLTPGAIPSVVWSKDGGLTWDVSNVDSVTTGNDLSGLACVGGNLVAISNDEQAIEYAPIEDILAGTETWTEVTTGIVGAGAPNAIYSASVSATWIVGDAGYIYFTANPVNGVSVQSAGDITAENLNSVHGVGSSILVIGGDNGVVLYSLNEGDTWTPATVVTGTPAVNAVWVLSEFVWLAGTDAGLFYTDDQGLTWNAVTLQGAITNISAISFANDQVGYLVGDDGAGNVFVFRTWDGGETWVLEPRQGTVPGGAANLNAVAACEEDINLVYIGGDDGANGGVVIKGA